MNQLPKPCPWCGHAALILPTNPKIEGDAWTQILCGNDDCKILPVSMTYYGDNKLEREAEAISDWNNRV